MKYVAALIAFFILFPTAIAEVPLPKRIDIVMIDTGSAKSFSGTLNLPKNCDDCWHPHGTWMARTLEDQLKLLHSRPVQGLQLVYRDIRDLNLDIVLATTHHPKVISMSIAGDSPSEAEYAAVRFATVKRGILVLAASGNQGLKHSEYPAGYDLPCLVSVSSKQNGHIAKWNKPASPGEIYLEAVDDEAGTSFSTQRAAAYALKFYQEWPNASCKEAKAYLVRKFGSIQ